MNGVKSILKSKTFWGIIASLFCRVLESNGIKILPEQEAAVNYDLLAVAGAAGDLWAIYGRAKADSKVTLTGSAPTDAPKA